MTDTTDTTDTTLREIFRSMDPGPAPDPSGVALRWLEDRDRAFGHWIDGRWTDSSPGERIELRIHGSRSTEIVTVAHGSRTDVTAALAAARAALPGWRAVGCRVRARCLRGLAHHVHGARDEVATLERLGPEPTGLRSGDPSSTEAAGIVLRASGWAQLLDDVPEFAGLEGIGVVGQILPPHASLRLLIRKVAPALAAGCAVVVKPGEHTPLAALRFAELTLDTGLPPGVVNVVTGDHRTGATLAAHSDVDGVAFTGSFGDARALRSAIAGSGRRLSLDLVGSGTVVVFEDADLDAVVDSLADANAAETHILAQEGIAPRLARKLKAASEIPVATFRTPSEAAELANGSRNRSSVSVWSQDIDVALDAASAIRAGSVWINAAHDLADMASDDGIDVLHAYLRPTLERTASIEEAPTESPTLSGRDRQRRPFDGDDDHVVELDRADRSVGTDESYDVDDAIEAARAAGGTWFEYGTHQRAGILHLMAEKLASRADAIVRTSGGGHVSSEAARAEVDACVQRLFAYAAWAEVYGGRARRSTARTLGIDESEPLGVVGLVAPSEPPLLGLLAGLAPLLALGNTVVALPAPGSAETAFELSRILDASGLPKGVANLVTGRQEGVAPALAADDRVDALWAFAPASLCADLERLAAGNMKRLWLSHGRRRDWLDPGRGAGPEFLRAATRLKTIRIPYGA